MNRLQKTLWVVWLLVAGLSPAAGSAGTPGESDATQDLVFGEELPEGLRNLQIFAEQNLSDGDRQGGLNEAVDTLLNEPIETIAIKRDSQRLARILAFGHVRSAHDLITRLLNRLAIPGDAPNYRSTLSGGVLPNAGIYPDEAHLLTELGLFGYVDNEDELASVMAHEMTHQNRAHLAAAVDTPMVDKLLDSLQGYKDLQPAQREEIRADLGSIDRMIRAGYNPWGAYNLQKKFTALYRDLQSNRVKRWLHKQLFKRSAEFVEAHPAGEIRMAAVKAYILQRGFQEDLSEQTAKFTPLPKSLSLLRLRMQLFQFPLLSKWVRRAQVAYMAHGALSALGATNWQAFKEALAVAKPVTDPAFETLGAVWRPVQGGLSTAAHAIGEAMTLPPGVWEWLNSHPGALLNDAWHHPATAWLLSHSCTLSSVGVFAFYGKVMHVGMLSADKAAYQNFSALVKNGPAFRKFQAALLSKLSRKQNPLPILERMLALSQEDLVRIRKIHDEEFSYIRFTRYLNGLQFAEWGALSRHEALLAATAQAMDKLPAEERRLAGARLEKLLEGTPPFVLENKRLRPYLGQILGISSSELEDPGRVLAALPERMKTYQEDRSTPGLEDRREVLSRLVNGMPADPLDDSAPKPTPSEIKAARKELIALNAEAPGPTLRQRTLLALAAEKFPEDATPEQALQISNALAACDQRDGASEILDRYHARIVPWVFSRDNLEPANGKLLAELENKLKQGSTLDPWVPRRNARWLDRKIVGERLKQVFSGSADKTAMASLSDEVEYPQAWGSFSRWKTLRHWLGKYDHARIRLELSSHFHSVQELDAFVRDELLPIHAMMDPFRVDFAKEILAHPEWLRTPEDIEALLSGEYFWPVFGGQGAEVGSLETSLVQTMKSLARKFPATWKYEPAASEKLHALVLEKAEALGVLSTEFEPKLELWKKLTSRGITTRTDELFQQLYSQATEEQKPELEGLALQGRIWEQELKARIAERRVLLSGTYQKLLKTRDAEHRKSLLDKLIRMVQRDYPERGIHYAEILEKISRQIRSTEAESGMIAAAKGAASGARSEDLGLRMVTDLLNEALSWRKSQQWDLVRFLRGDIEPTRKIQKAFRTVGPDRVRRAFSLLPVLTRAGMLDSFLDSPAGLLPKVSIQSGYARTIVQHVMREGDPEAAKIGQEVLEGFLYSLKETGNEPLQSYVLSYLLAMPRSQNSVGETLRNVLEIFGTTGIKIGQALVATDLLPEDEARHLRALQEMAKVPEREKIYEDFRTILRGKKLPFALDDLLGAASLKYAVRAREEASEEAVVLKVLRLDAIAHTKAEFLQLGKMAEYLVKKHGQKYGVFRSIIKASEIAVRKELSFPDEVERGRIARGEIYKGLENEGMAIEVPRETLMSGRLIAAEFAEGVSFRDLPPAQQDTFARKILTDEGQILLGEQPPGKTLLRFDRDRHPGNYRFKVAELGEKLKLSPIDFGQLERGMTYEERGQAIDLFSLAQILKKTGATEWSVSEIEASLGRNWDGKKRAALLKSLGTYFPSEQLREVTSYFSVLSALDDVGEAYPSSFFDWVMAIIQLNQYEKYVDFAKGPIQTPKMKLESAVRSRSNEYLSRLHLTSFEKIKFAWNGFRPADMAHCLRGILRGRTPAGGARP